MERKFLFNLLLGCVGTFIHSLFTDHEYEYFRLIVRIFAGADVYLDNLYYKSLAEIIRVCIHVLMVFVLEPRGHAKLMALSITTLLTLRYVMLYQFDTYFFSLYELRTKCFVNIESLKQNSPPVTSVAQILRRPLNELWRQVPNALFDISSRNSTTPHDISRITECTKVLPDNLMLYMGIIIPAILSGFNTRQALTFVLFGPSVHKYTFLIQMLVGYGAKVCAHLLWIPLGIKAKPVHFLFGALAEFAFLLLQIKFLTDLSQPPVQDPAPTRVETNAKKLIKGMFFQLLKQLLFSPVSL